MQDKIFISFASRDRELAADICSALEERGFHCWISYRDVRGGENYQDAISRAIRGAKVMVLVFTANTNTSNEVKKELSLASKANLVVIPLRLEDVQPGAALDYELATRQWIDLLDDRDRALQRLGDQIAELIATAPQTPSNSDAESHRTKISFAGMLATLLPSNYRGGNAAAFATKFAVAMISAIFALCLFFFDPLYIDTAKNGSLDNWFQRFYSSDYPSDADEHLAVVLIDQPSLEEWKADWPVPYDYLVGIIYRLSCARAAAAFFDLIPVSQYSDLEGQDRLAMAVADSSQIDQPCPDASRPQRIPVFFGGSDTEKSRLLKDMTSGQGHLFNLETNVEPGIYPVGRETFPNRPVRDNEITPAFGLLRRLCGAGSVNLVAPLDCNVREALSSNRPLVVRWSGKVAPEQDDIYPTDACLQTPGFWGQLLFSLNWSSAGEYQPCRPILTIPANALISGNIRTAKPGTDPVLDMMKGRVVLVGVDLPLLNDVVPSPVHGRLPGVYVHAMALSNLLTYGDKYPTKPDYPDLLLVLVPLFLCLELLRRFGPELFRGAKFLGNKDKTSIRYQDLLLASAALALVLTFATGPNLLFGASWGLQFVLFVLILKVLIYYYAVPVTELARLLMARLLRAVDKTS